MPRISHIQFLDRNIICYTEILTPSQNIFQLTMGKADCFTVTQLISTTSTPLPASQVIFNPLGCLLKNCFLSVVLPMSRLRISPRTLSSEGCVPPQLLTKAQRHPSATVTPQCLVTTPVARQEFFYLTLTSRLIHVNICKQSERCLKNTTTLFTFRSMLQLGHYIQ